MLLQAASLLLVAAGLAHAWLQLFNRWLISIRDTAWKPWIHRASLVAMVALPTAALALLRDAGPVDEALRWSPSTGPARGLFLAFGALWLFAAWRGALWLADRAWPPRSHHILSQTVSLPKIDKPAPRFPAFMGRLETTFDLEAVELEIAVPGLPAAFDGLSIAHVADAHFDPRDGWLDYYKSVADIVNGWDADIVAFTGDFVNRRRFIRVSGRYHGLMRGRLATLAVLGNHDYWTDAGEVREACAAAGIRAMHNERWVLERHGRRLVFAGTDMPWGKTRSDLPQLLAHGTADAAVLLSHSPDNAPAAARAGANLVLAGHNHGGQYCLPLVGPVCVPSRTGHRFVEGVFDLEDSCVLVVSRGVGCSFHQRGGRILSRPQVVKLVLRAELLEEQIGVLARGRAAAARPALPG